MTKAQALLNWIDERLPVTSFWKSQLSEYYAPKNFNFWYYFGSLALLVLVGICTHLGCSPVERLAAEPEPFAADWHGGFYCPCHGSLFDLAGRVYKNKPAPDNLTVPPYKFLSATTLIIGEDTKGA